MQYRQMLLTILILASVVSGSEDVSEKEFKKAPDFTAKTLKGKNYTLSKNIGSGPVVINFWATWCVPCALEMESLKTLYEKYNEKGVTFLSVSIDDMNSVSQVPGVTRSRKYPFTVLLDPGKMVSKKYHVTDVPQVFIVDNKGYIVYEHYGYSNGDETVLESTIKKLLEDVK